MITLVSSLALAMGLLGYALFCTWKGIRSEFIPGIIACAVICCMFVAGVLNFLVVASWGLVAVGVFLLFQTCSRISSAGAWRTVGREWLTPGNGIMLVFLALIAVLTYGQPFRENDEFFHWGLIVKQMFNDNRLPTQASVIVFKAYPPGSALFIYFVTRFISYGEGQALFGQGALTAACIWPLLAFVPRQSKGAAGLFRMGVSLAAALSVIVVVLTRCVYYLMVDELLAAAAIGGFAVAYAHRKTFWKAVWLSLPFAVSATLIKNSGLLFAVAQALLLLGCYLRYGRYGSTEHEKKRNRLALLCGACIPIVCLLLWLAHVDMVFSDGLLTPHALGLDRFQARLSEKTMEDIGAIFRLVFAMVFSFQNPLLVHLLLWNAALLVLALVIFANKQKGYRSLLWIVLYCDAMFVLYVLGLVGTYVFSMSRSEALEAASAMRYLFTIYAYCAGLFVAVGLTAVQGLSNRRLATLCLLALCLPMYQAVAVGRLSNFRILKPTRYATAVDHALSFETRTALTAVYAPTWAERSGALEAILRYKLNAKVDHFTMILEPDEDADRLWQRISAYEVLVVVDEDAFIGRVIEEHWQQRQTYVGTYLLEQAR